MDLYTTNEEIIKKYNISDEKIYNNLGDIHKFFDNKTDKKEDWSGSYGIVYKGKFNSQDIVYKISRDKCEPLKAKYLLDNKKIFENFVPIVGFINITKELSKKLYNNIPNEDDEDLEKITYIIVSKFIDCGSLGNFIDNKYKITFTNYTEIINKIVHVMQLLVDNNYIYTDLKPENILLNCDRKNNKKKTIYITDLGGLEKTTYNITKTTERKLGKPSPRFGGTITTPEIIIEKENIEVTPYSTCDMMITMWNPSLKSDSIFTNLPYTQMKFELIWLSLLLFCSITKDANVFIEKFTEIHKDRDIFRECIKYKFDTETLYNNQLSIFKKQNFIKKGLKKNKPYLLYINSFYDNNFEIKHKNKIKKVFISEIKGKFKLTDKDEKKFSIPSDFYERKKLFDRLITQNIFIYIRNKDDNIIKTMILDLIDNSKEKKIHPFFSVLLDYLEKEINIDNNFIVDISMNNLLTFYKQFLDKLLLSNVKDKNIVDEYTFEYKKSKFMF